MYPEDRSTEAKYLWLGSILLSKCAEPSKGHPGLRRMRFMALKSATNRTLISSPGFVCFFTNNPRAHHVVAWCTGSSQPPRKALLNSSSAALRRCNGIGIGVLTFSGSMLDSVLMSNLISSSVSMTSSGFSSDLNTSWNFRH